MGTSSINSQSVQATMLIPLYGRAKMSELHPKLIHDGEAMRIVAEIDMDFSQIEKAFGEYGGASYLTRARRMDAEVSAFLRRYPRGTIVNIGSGLDTTFSRVDNGEVLWYNLDLPDAIAYRRQLIKPVERSVDIPKSVFDYRWLDEITLGSDGQLLLIAAGVFFYLEPDDLREMMRQIIDRFPSGELFFDAASGIGYKISNRMVRKSGNSGAQMHFYVNGARPLYAWSPKIKCVELSPFFGDAKNLGIWSRSTRLQMQFCDILGMGKYVKITW